jgi:signal transduction histidine kinase
MSIITISVVSGYIFFSYLRNNLLQHEINISGEFIQSITLINNHEKYFFGEKDFYDRHEVDEFLQHIISMPDVFRVVAYDADLKIIWANNPALIGKTYTDNEELNKALSGINLYEEADREHRAKEEHDTIPEEVDKFIESYLPVWDRKGNRVIGVLEIYKSPQALYRAINEARLLVMVVSLLGAIILHTVLYWIVHTANQLIETQRVRIKVATNRAVELNEQNLRRIGSDLHDGPAQSIGFALLRLDSMLETDRSTRSQTTTETFNKIQMALEDALQEIRGLSAGLIIPELDDLSLQEAIQKLIEKHQKRTSTKVSYTIENLPPDLKMSTKICAYRLVQEGLSNAYRHGLGKRQAVDIRSDRKYLQVAISDAGPGMRDEDITAIDDSCHLGLRGLRERVESLGGNFDISSNDGQPGVKLTAQLPWYD